MESTGQAQTTVVNLYTPHTTCRACRHPELVPVLDLGLQPLANAFRRPGDTSPEVRYPLELLRCPECELLQLSVVVNPRVMYGPGYPYRSGYSEGWALHCHALAKQIGRDKRVLEIGCLDGVMLRHCRENGCDVQGIDPSSPVIELPIIRELFGRDTRFTGYFDAIVAQNVFGHVDDAEGFLLGIRNALHSTGYAIIECPWVVDLIDGVRWDTVYHEHLSYWGVRPLMRLAQSVGLAVTHTQAFPEIHGGTMRYRLEHAGANTGIDPYVYATWRDEEMGLSDWRRFHDRTRDAIDYWTEWFSCAGGDAVAAYGASAKLNTFLNALPEHPGLVAVFDDSPVKQGLVTPGWQIPVLAPTAATLAETDVLLVGAPNWIAGIEAKARGLGFQGQVKSLWA